MKKYDKKIILFIIVTIMIIASCVTVFASSYSSTLLLYSGNSFYGSTRTYTGKTLGISFTGTNPGWEDLCVIQPYEVILGLRARALPYKYVNPTSVNNTWSMDNGNTITADFQFYFFNPPANGTWSSDNVNMYSN